MVANEEVNSCSAWALKMAEQEVLGARYDQGYATMLYRLTSPVYPMVMGNEWYRVRRLTHRCDSAEVRQSNRDCQVLCLLLCAEIATTDRSFLTSGRE